MTTIDELKAQCPSLAMEIDALATMDYPAASIASAIRIAGERDLEPSFALWALAGLLRRLDYPNLPAGTGRDSARPSPDPAQPSSDGREGVAPVLEQLVAAQGIGRYAFFFVTGEGEQFPDGNEEWSGHVIDERGHVYSFGTDWDEGRGGVVLTEWEQVEPEAHWLKSAEYRRAREAVGL